MKSLLEHISHFGIDDTLNKSRGMFAFSLYDKNNNLILAKLFWWPIIAIIKILYTSLRA